MKKPDLAKTWLWWRRQHWCKRFAGYAAILITGFYGVENIRGWWAWRSYRAAAEVRGDRFELGYHLQPDVPRELNFTWAPVVRPMFLKGQPFVLPGSVPKRFFEEEEMWQTLESPFFSFTEPPHYLVCQPISLESYFSPLSPERDRAAEALLEQLEPWDSFLSELKTAAERPHCKSPFDFIKEPDLLYSGFWNPCLKAAAILEIRALASLRNGDASGGASDLTGMLRVIRHRCEDPAGWGPRRHHARLSYALQGVWEGLVSGAWDEESLDQIGAPLAQIDVWRAYARQVAIERALMIESLDSGRHHRWRDIQFNSEVEDLPWLMHCRTSPPLPDPNGKPGWYSDLHNFMTVGLILLAPGGWFDQNKVAYCRAVEPAMQTRFDSPPSSARRPDPPGSPYNFLVSGFTNGSSAVLIRYRVQENPYAEALQRLAQIAIALERFRLAEGEYPDSLSSLAPRFLDAVPLDPYTDSTPIFRIENGRPVVYSIGANRIDDGGEMSLNRERGDIVWRYELPSGVSLDDF